MSDPVYQDHLLDDLRRQGYRITAQRRQVLEVLLAQQDAHLSHEEVTQALAARGHTLNAVTVYRVLQWLKDAGLVAQTDLGGGHDVYCWIGETVHHHLICLNCEHIIEMDDAIFEPLRQMLRERYGFQPRIEHFAIFGLCMACKQAQETDTD